MLSVFSFSLFSCEEKINVKKYSNEVTYEEFMEKYKESYKNSVILTGLTEKNFVQTCFNEVISKTSYNYDEEAYDVTIYQANEAKYEYNVETFMSYETSVSEYQQIIEEGFPDEYQGVDRKVEENKKVYVRTSDVMEYFARRFDVDLSYVYYKDYAKYYVDGDTFTWTYNSDDIQDSILNQVRPKASGTVQITINDKLVSYYENYIDEYNEENIYIVTKFA